MRVALSCLFLISGLSAIGQNVGIGINTPHPSAVLDASSTTQGMLIPRMNKLQKNAIPAPAKGLLIFQDDVDSIGFHYYDGTVWLWLEALGKAGWKTGGNAGTDTASHFIGTTDNMPLRFKQNNTHLGQWDLSKSNYFIGKDAGKASGLIPMFAIGIGDSALATGTSASFNVAIGNRALKLNQHGSNNLAYGSFTLENLKGSGFGGNIAIGTSALRNAQNVQFNTAVGVFAMQEHRINNNNTAIGFQALTLDTTGFSNVAVGAHNLGRNVNGTRNVAVGTSAGFNNTSGNRNTYVGNAVNASEPNYDYDPAFTGSNNTAVGAVSFYNNISGNKNTAVGDSALLINTTGNNNIAIGSKSLMANKTGNNNTVIGYEANTNATDLTNAVAIGAHARVDTSNAMVLGSVINVNGASQGVNVGIGTTKPLAKLHVQDSSVLFMGRSTINPTPGDPPVRGAGVRMMWYPDKAAFRAGWVNGTEWNKDNIGNYSVAMGNDNLASGFSSFSMGDNSWALGSSSIALGSGVFSLGNASVAMGNSATAEGNASVSLGLQTSARGNRSMAINEASDAIGIGSLAAGSSTVATGNYSTTLGDQTVGRAFASLTIGRFNDSIITSNPTSWVSADPLFIIGNGTSDAARNNALVVLKNGSTGLGTSAPGARLDVSGTAILGVNGTVLTEVIKVTINRNLASIAANSSVTENFTVANSQTGSMVYVSPGSAFANGLLIGYARVSAAGNVEVRFTNTTGTAIDPPAMDFYITVIR